MKTALVTGASRGLGFGFVKNLLDQDYKVFATFRKLHAAEPLAALEHPNLTKCEMDVADDDSINRAFKKISDETDHLDLLINNAGINHDSPNREKEATTKLGHLTRDELTKMLEINSVGALLVTQTFAPLLKNSKVVNISSYRASFTNRDQDKNYNNYGYSASKVALNMFTRDLAHDLTGRALVYAIDPGSVHTAMHSRGAQEPDAAAATIVKTVATMGEEESGGFFDKDGHKHER